MQGLVLSATNNLFKVLCEDGCTRLCAIKGKRISTLTGSYNSLAAGDTVELAPTDSGRGLILALNPRRNVFGRFNEKGRAEQAIAANIDLVVCVSSPHLPPFRPRFVDRVAVLAEAASSPLLIVLNKADLDIPAETAERLEGYRGLGYGVAVLSAKKGRGIEELREALKGRTSVLTGQSGVGKSSLLNVLYPGLDRKTGEVSIKYDRGKHTTTLAEMMLPGDTGTRVIDTPGMRRLALRGLDPSNLAAYFPEMRRLVGECGFGLSCTHIDEENCGIVAGVERGEVHPDRYESFLRIRDELESAVDWKRSGNRDPGRKERTASARSRRHKSSTFDQDDDDPEEHAGEGDRRLK